MKGDMAVPGEFQAGSVMASYRRAASLLIRIRRRLALD
jgi:hypothetical protein